jgi:branched-chain amino acid transport system substrate-binding protein
MTKKLLPLVAALALALPDAGRAQAKIGFINSITGPEAPIGENLTNGVDMAVEDLKKQGVTVTVV